ncbi:MAG: hypothetical protein FJZ96_11910 [Chloroflexi bacterium]|nr:hypothetical protein [Chloroflexota bacterium]
MIKKMIPLVIAGALLLSVLTCGTQTTGSNSPATETGAPDTTAGASPAPTGSTVTSGPPFIEQVSAQVDIPAAGSGAAIAACPAGSLLVSGGFSTGENVRIDKSMPTSAGWSVEGQNTGVDAQPLLAYAYCLHNVPGAAKIVSVDYTMRANETYDGAFAYCQSGDLITGGGYAINVDGMEVYNSGPLLVENGQNGWNIMAQKNGNEELVLSIYAVCLSGSGLTNKRIFPESSGGDAGDSLVNCPPGTLLVAGGYDGTGTHINRISPSDASAWEVSSRDGDETMSHVICLNLP